MTTKEKVEYIKNKIGVNTLKDLADILNIKYNYLRNSISEDSPNEKLICSFLAYCLEKGISIDNKILNSSKKAKKIYIEKSRCFKCKYSTIDYSRFEDGELYCNLYSKFLKEDATNKSEQCYNFKNDNNIYTLV